MKREVLFVVGARPQFVKLAPLARAVSRGRSCAIVHTGQHYDHLMSDLLFEELEIPKPDYNLGVGSGSHGAQTGRMLIELERVFCEERPRVVVTFGDTNSTLAASLAAVKLGIPSVHIEAGLRGWNREEPEEINRIVSDHTCDYLYAPTHTAMVNLAAEGLAKRSILTGDIMVDTVKQNVGKALARPSAAAALGVRGSFWLLTMHRPYNVDDPARLRGILEGLNSLGRQILFPVHPRTANVLGGMGDLNVPNVKMVKPQGYLDFIQLQHGCDGIITDSGGVQKEAYIMEKPCVTLCGFSEWVEATESGWNSPTEPLQEGWIEKIASFHPPKEHPDLYGTDVAELMRSEIEKML